MRCLADRLPNVMKNGGKFENSLFKQFFNVIQKFIVIVVTGCTCEMSFSKLILVKSKLRSTTKQNRLNALTVLRIEQEMAVNVNADAVIDNFKIVVYFKRRMSIIILSEFYVC